MFKKFLGKVICPQTVWLPRYYILFKMAKFNKNDMVLDVCCGEGIITMKLAGMCRKVIGLDISAGNIQSANIKKEKSKFKQKVDFVLGNILQLPFPDNFFDKVVFLDALPEIEQDTTALAEISRVLKPQGSLFISAASSYTCASTLFKEQRILRRIVPGFLYRKYLPGGKSWLDADEETIRKNLHICRNYTLDDLCKKAYPLLEVSRYKYILKKYGALATDITYGIKGLWPFRFLFFWPAVRMDYYFDKDKQGYSIFVEFRKNKQFKNFRQ